MKDQQNTIYTEADTKLIQLFIDTSGLENTNAQLINLNSRTINDRCLFNDKCSSIPKDTHSVVVIIDDSNVKLPRKIKNLFLRRKNLKICEMFLRNSDFTDINFYAIYPNLERLSVIYQINSLAAKYADNYLLSEDVTVLKRVIFSLLKLLRIESPTIDVTAVVGTK